MYKRLKDEIFACHKSAKGKNSLAVEQVYQFWNGFVAGVQQQLQDLDMLDEEARADLNRIRRCNERLYKKTLKWYDVPLEPLSCLADRLSTDTPSEEQATRE